MSHGEVPLVLHVIHHLVMGGLENGLVNLINRMPASRFRHAVACVEDYSDFRERITRPDVEVFAIRRSQIGTWGLRRAIYDLCKRLNPTILHSRNMSGLDAILPARLAGVRHCVHGEHGWDVNDLNGGKRKPAFLRRMHAPFVDRYITVSRQLERYLVDRVGIDRAKITQIYNGVDTEKFSPAVGRPLGVLPPGFADPESLVIGTVGRIQAVKDQRTLIRAFAMLRESRELAARVRLAIVGNGPLLPSLRELAESLGLGDSVWMPGALSNVADVLRSYDVFVLPSLSEGISNTILEAMACGVPILATRAGGNAELVDDGVNGNSFRPGDVNELASLLRIYASDAELRRVRSQLARQVSIDRFGLERMVGAYLSVYEGFGARGSLPLA